MDNRTILPGALAVAALTAATSAMTLGYATNLVSWIAIAVLTASSMRFVLLIGELNFATAAFVGLGAYGAGVASTLLEWPFLLCLLFGGLVSVVVGFGFGYVTLRTKGPYFLLIGFAFTEVVRLIYTKVQWLGGNSGMVGIFPPRYLDAWYPSVVVAVAGLLLLGLYALEKSDFGKTCVAIRDNDAVVQSVGINVHLTKVACLCVAAFAAGIAGGLSAFVNNVISPGDFGFLLSTFALAYLKVGGEDHPLGPVAGAVLLVLLASVAMSMGAGEHVFYGLAIVLSVLLMPKGMTGLATRGWARRKRSAA